MKLSDITSYLYKYQSSFLITIFLIELVWFAYNFRQPTANNDIFIQLLSTDKILSSFDFSDTFGHPIGIPMLSSFVIMLGLSPIIVMYYLIPKLSMQ